jgi:hypothetical protein
MEVYQWLLRGNGFNVSPRGYFVYVNGKKDREAFDARLEFDVHVIPYDGDDRWIVPALKDIRATLESDALPPSGERCEHCPYRDAAGTSIRELVTGTAKKRHAKPTKGTLF